MPKPRNYIGYAIGKLPVHSGELGSKAWESECVASLEYDFERQQATCHFHKRGSYTYFDFDAGTFAEWNQSSSRGTFFNLYVRDRYDYERVG